MACENNSMALDPDAQTKMHNSFWKSQTESIENVNMRDLKLQDLPLARIKKIMKLDESVKMISAEVPILFAKAAELFISEITMRGWWCTEENKRRTLQKSDIALAASRYDQFDFLIDIVPREEIKPSPKKQTFPITVPNSTQPQFQYYFQVPLVGSGSNINTSTTLTQSPIIQQHMAALPNINNNPQGQIFLQQATPLILNPNNMTQINFVQNAQHKSLDNHSQIVSCNANSSHLQTSLSYPLYLVSPSIASGLVKSTSSTSTPKTNVTPSNLNASPENTCALGSTTPSQSVLVKNTRKQIHSPHPHLHQNNTTGLTPANLEAEKISSIFGIDLVSTFPKRNMHSMNNQPFIDTSVSVPKLQETLLTTPSKSASKVEKLNSLPSSPNHTIQLTQQQLEALLGVRIHNLASSQNSPVKNVTTNHNSAVPPKVENKYGCDTKD